MNPFRLYKAFFGSTIYTYATAILAISLVFYVTQTFPLGMHIGFIVLSSIIIWRAGDFFSPAARYIEHRHNIPQSVKAAVIDAIASSFPEFAVAVIAVLLIGKADVGIATIAGSALYNVLVIPAAAGIVASSPLIVSKEVVWRDNLYYVFVVMALLGLSFMFPVWGVGVALIFLLMYVAYVLMLHRHYLAHNKEIANSTQKEEASLEEEESVTIGSEKAAWTWIIGMMLLMGLATHLLVESSIALGDLLGIHHAVMAFVIIAAGTSVPDMVLSVISAKKGDYDASISNVFGSNIFDICVCLSLPILLALALTGKTTTIGLEQPELLWILLVATLVAFIFFFTNRYTLNKVKSWLMLLMYSGIVVYVFTI